MLTGTTLDADSTHGAYFPTMLSLPMLLLLAAFVVTIAHSIGKSPLWPAVLLLIVVVWVR